MIINLGCASVDNHIPRDDIFDYHPLKNVIFIYYKIVSNEDPGVRTLSAGLLSLCLLNYVPYKRHLA